MGYSTEDPIVADTIRSFFAASALLDSMRLRIWDRDGLTVTQLRLLTHLYEQEGLSNAELADRLFVTRPSVSALLERLERGGFIRREVAPNDRRGICIWLEERGRTAVSSLRAELQRDAANLMEKMSRQEIEDFGKSLNRFVESGRARRAQEFKPEEDS